MISTLEDTIRRDRALAAVCVALITSLAWLYLIRMSASMTTMGSGVRIEAMEMVDTRIWGPASWFGLFGMWAVMMTGMMLPSVSPVLLHMLQIYRRRGDHLARRSAVVFVGGHLVAWMLFGAVAATVQIGLHRVALLSASFAIESTVLTGALLLAVGIYQCLPVKSACLTHCQSTAPISVDEAAGWDTRRIHDGAAARRLLRRMLLRTDDADVRGRRDEPGVGGRHRHPGADGKESLRVACTLSNASGLPLIVWGGTLLGRQLAG